jgi:hypothetical protein
LGCIICIDAFTVDPNRLKSKGFAYNDGPLQTDKQHNAEQKIHIHNSFFLVQLTPWDRTFKMAPMHLLSWNSGMASASIREVLNDVIRSVIPADQRIKIAFISVDGDEGYESNFARCFSQTKACLAQPAFTQGKLIKYLIVLCPFWISDWLHLLKNARTRLFSGQICMNPPLKSEGVSITGLQQYFGKCPTFTDSISLGKMRDSYPLDLFSLAIAFICENTTQTKICSCTYFLWGSELKPWKIGILTWK